MLSGSHQVPHGVDCVAAVSGSFSGPRSTGWCLHLPSRTYCLRCLHIGTHILGLHASWWENNSEVLALVGPLKFLSQEAPRQPPDIFSTMTHLVLLHREERGLERDTCFPEVLPISSPLPGHT